MRESRRKIRRMEEWGVWCVRVVCVRRNEEGRVDRKDPRHMEGCNKIEGDVM
jgi:hypothetical protein